MSAVRLNRRAMAPLAILPAALALLAPVVADAAVPRTCDRLTGTPVIQTAAIKIVKRAYRSIPRRVPPNTSLGGFVGKGFYGCSLPAGKVRRLGAAGTTYLYERGPNGRPRREPGVYSFQTTRFRRATGSYVLQFRGTGIEGGAAAGTYQSGDVRNVATGKRYSYWSDQNGDNGDSLLTPLPPLAVKLTEQGILAGVFVDMSAERSVRGFNAAGTMTVFDRAPQETAGDIPVDSLGLSGTTVSWTNAGVAKSAEITP